MHGWAREAARTYLRLKSSVGSLVYGCEMFGTSRNALIYSMLSSILVLVPVSDQDAVAILASAISHLP